MKNNEFLKFQSIFSPKSLLYNTNRATRFYGIHLFVQMQLPGIDAILWMWWWWVRPWAFKLNRILTIRIDKLNVALTSFECCFMFVIGWWMICCLFHAKHTYTREWELLLKSDCFFILFVIEVYRFLFSMQIIPWSKQLTK